MNPAKPTPERIAALRAQIAKESEGIATLRKARTEDNAKWEREISALEQRVATAAIEIPLCDGVTIAIRTSLSVSESRLLNELDSARKAEEDFDKRNELSAEMLELMTLNPMITKEWLLSNPDKYSPSDVLKILTGFMEVRLQERMDKIKSVRDAASFLPQSRGNSVR
jgi:hypothetical protein